jgi:hypothetical protein
VSDRRKQVFVLTNNAINKIVNVCVVLPTLGEQMIVVHRRCINCHVILPNVHVDCRLVARLVTFQGSWLLTDRELLNYFQVQFDLLHHEIL